MNRTILAVLLLWSVQTLTAVAADLPSKMAEPEFEEPPPIPIFSWSGFYAGVHAGADFVHDAGTFGLPMGGVGRFGLSPWSVSGGAHTGYNHALGKVLGEHDLVVGLEGDIDGADLSRSTTAFGDRVSSTSDVKGSIRGRVGVAASRVLCYATGGLAIADLEARYRTTPAYGPVVGGSTDKTVSGYTIGAGVEYAFMNSYALRAEYRTSRYGAPDSPLSSSAPLLPTTVSHRETDNRLQAGISYRFEPADLSEPTERN